MNSTITSTEQQVHMERSASTETTQFHVYQNLHFIKDLRFEKSRITIGSSRHADLFLDHQSVAGIHALVDIKNGKAVLTNQFPENGLRLNGEPVLNARLQYEDVIAIGPFSLKIKKAGRPISPATDDNGAYCVRLVNHYKNQTERDKAVAQLARLLKLDAPKTRALIVRDHFIVKRGLTGLEAARIQNTLLRAGVICVVQFEKKSQERQTLRPVESIPLRQTAKETGTIPTQTTASAAHVDEKEAEKTSESPIFSAYEERVVNAHVEEEDEEEEALWEAPFSIEKEVGPSLVASQQQNVAQIKPISWRAWAISLGIHCACILFLLLYTAIQAHAPSKQTLHFVKIDRSMLEQIKPPKPKATPKKKPAIKAEPPKTVKKEKTPKAVSKQKARTSSVQSNKPKKPATKRIRRAEAAKHPKAGGGVGEGNVKNRNVNQTGLLSVLGSASPDGPSKAMVAVTNLDAVKVPGATEKQFSVGGLKGKLGNSSIAVASGQIVQTKGSTQVLRSAGAGGKGEVAALARGETGKQQVQAMVTAKLSRTVKIEGGMSREMVKKVIDQHLDEITYCYETALITNPSILGRVVFEWKIRKNGRVGEVRIVSSSVNSHQIHDCIKSAIQSWQFPKPVGTEVIVSYPFVFDLVSF